LKTLEKINRKGNRNSRKIGKANSAQGSPLSPAHARASLCLTGGPRLSAQTRAPSLPRSLAAPWDRPVGAVALACARFLSLSAQPTPPVSASLISRPRSPRRGRAHVCAFSGHDRAPAPLLNPVPCSPTSPLPFAPSAHLSLSLSLSLCPREPRTSATACQRPPPVPWPPLRPCPVQCHGKLRLAVSYSGHPLLCPLSLSLVCPVHAHWSGSCAAGAPPPSPHHVHVPPSLPCASSASPQGEQPPRAPISLCTALVSTHLLARVAPRCR
jgi:hypothetical protein